jgi:hypothetical protein
MHDMAGCTYDMKVCLEMDTQSATQIVPAKYVTLKSLAWRAEWVVHKYYKDSLFFSHVYSIIIFLQDFNFYVGNLSTKPLLLPLSYSEVWHYIHDVGDRQYSRR